MVRNKDEMLAVLHDLHRMIEDEEITALVYAAPHVGRGYVIGYEGELSTDDWEIVAEQVANLASNEIREVLEALVEGNGSHRLVIGSSE